MLNRNGSYAYEYIFIDLDSNYGNVQLQLIVMKYNYWTENIDCREKYFLSCIKDKIYFHFCLKFFVYPKYLSWHSTFICEMISDIKRKY